MTEGNRFTHLLSVAVKAEPKSKKSKKIDFGANLESDPALTATFKKLHETFSSLDSKDNNSGGTGLHPEIEDSPPGKPNSACEYGRTDSIDGQDEINKPVYGTGHGTDPVTDHRMDGSQDGSLDVGMSGRMTGRFPGQSRIVTSHGMGLDTHPGTHPVTHPHSVTPKQRIHSPIWLLSKQQAKILWFLIKAGGLTKRDDIASGTGVPFGTVKNALSSLHYDGFISKPKPYTDRAFRGISYDLNKQLCEQFMLERGHSVFEDNGTRPGIRPNTGPYHGPVTGLGTDNVTYPDRTHYSSSLESNTTTASDVENLLRSDPELSYWQEKGLQVQQVLTWLEETNMTPAIMIQSLKYCRFEMVDMNFEEQKEIKNLFNWFYRIIKRTGFYPKPSQYISWNEKMMELEKTLLEEQEAETKRMAEFRTRKYHLAIERKFQEMMNNPQSETYKQVYDKLSKLEKELGEGLAFERAMRSRFNDIIETPQI